MDEGLAEGREMLKEEVYERKVKKEQENLKKNIDIKGY